MVNEHDRERARRRRKRQSDLERLGPQLTPALLAETRRLCAIDLPDDFLSGVEVIRDAAYGDHERQVLDVYLPAADLDAARPIVLYVHGGGFVAGSKGGAESPFGPNIGAWAANCGFVGVAMNYRLAPAASWPDGGDDIAAAVAWLHANAERLGADAAGIVLVGQSAGAMHVADYLSGRRSHGAPAVAGAALISCIYDVGAAADLPMHRAYWGDDLDSWRDKGSVETILETSVPLFLAVAEHDEPQFVGSAVALTAAWLERHGTFPPLHLLSGHNHLSTVYAIGSPDDSVGPMLRGFVLDNATR